jgi:hypothetical protein
MHHGLAPIPSSSDHLSLYCQICFKLFSISVQFLLENFKLEVVRFYLDHLEGSCEKCRNIKESQGGKEYRTNTKKKES